MTRQTNSKLYKIRRFGCYFYTMLFFAEKITKKELTEEQILSLYDRLQKKTGYGGKPVMDANCRLNDPESVTNLAVVELGGTDYIKQIGVEQNGVVTLWGWVKKGTTPDFIAEEWLTPYGSHFLCSEYNPDPSLKIIELKRKILYKLY